MGGKDDMRQRLGPARREGSEIRFLVRKAGNAGIIDGQFNRANQTHQKNVYLSPEALDLLTVQPWPGNIRELGNCIERMVLLAEHTLVQPAQLQHFLPGPEAPGSTRLVTLTPVQPPAQARAAVPACAMGDTRAGLERHDSTPLEVRPYLSTQTHTVQMLQQALEAHQGNQSRAAQSLGLTLRQFSYRLRKAGLR